MTTWGVVFLILCTQSPLVQSQTGAGTPFTGVVGIAFNMVQATDW